MEIMSLTITAILLICGYLALVQAVNALSRRFYYFNTVSKILLDEQGRDENL